MRVVERRSDGSVSAIELTAEEIVKAWPSDWLPPHLEFVPVDENRDAYVACVKEP